MAPKAKPKAGKGLFGHGTAHLGKISKQVQSLRRFKPKSLKCVQCGKDDAVNWCVECKKAMCKFCTGMLHYPTMKTETHSIEEIDVLSTTEGAEIITPILLDVMAVVSALWVFSKFAITKEYLDGEAQCPFLTFGRAWVTRIDVNMFFIMKREMAYLCDIEDSHWRLYIDAWVRSIVTGVDSFLLLYASFWKALFFEEFVRRIGGPVLGVLYAILQLLCHNLEDLVIPRNDITVKIEKFVKDISLSKRLAPIGALSPKTFFRKRPMTDHMELLRYTVDREVRIFKYYNGMAQAMVNYMFLSALLFTFLFRALCILSSKAHMFFQIIFKMFFGGWMDKQAQVFTEVTGLQASYFDTSQNRQSDQALTKLFYILIKMVQGLFDWREAEEVLNAGQTSFKFVLGRFWVYLVLIVVAYILHQWLIQKERKVYQANWVGVRDEIYCGDCGADKQAWRSKMMNWDNDAFSFKGIHPLAHPISLLKEYYDKHFKIEEPPSPQQGADSQAEGEGSNSGATGSGGGGDQPGN